MPAMHDLTKGLSKKIGPLKAWQWGLIIGGGGVVYAVLKKNGLSLGGSTATTKTDDAGLYDAGTSVTGTGTSGGSSGGSDNGTAPQPITIQIQSAEPADTTDLEAKLKAAQEAQAAAETATQAEKDAAAKAAAEAAANVAKAKEREQKRVTAWANWGRKWKTQAAKNAKRIPTTPKQKKAQTTTKKALPPTKKTTPKPKTTASTSAKRSTTTQNRTIAKNTAAKKVLKPKVPVKKPVAKKR